MTSVSCNRSQITAARANGMAVMHSKPRSLCERTCLSAFCTHHTLVRCMHTHATLHNVADLRIHYLQASAFTCTCRTCITTFPILHYLITYPYACSFGFIHSYYTQTHMIAHAHTHTIHQYRHASIAYRFFRTLHHSDEPSACTIIIFIQALALFHRAQVST